MVAMLNHTALKMSSGIHQNIVMTNLTAHTSNAMNHDDDSCAGDVTSAAAVEVR